MIDRLEVQNEFDAYTSQFDSCNLLISNKRSHTFHVAENCDWIARQLDLDDNAVDICWLIGMLHDIGRFEQVKRIHGYTDKDLDHAELGVKLLFNEGMIYRFISDDEWTNIIKKSIKYHNKLDLPDDLGEKEKLFCDIIRDADKADNFRGFCENDFVSFHERTLKSVQESEITDGVMQCFRERKTIPHALIKTDADFFLLPYALYFGIVLDCTKVLVKNQDYYRQMLTFEFSRQDNRDRFKEIISCIRTVY